MRFTSPSRRALGLLAVSAIGMSTAVLGVAGIASAAPYEGETYFEVSAGGDPLDITVPAGVCAIDWTVVGGAGDDAGDPSPAGLVETTTKVTEDQVFTLEAGYPAETGTELDGEASRVTIDGAPYLRAHGGEGSDDSASTGSNTFLASIDPQFSTNGTTADSGYGGDVSAEFVTCPYDVVRLNAYAGNGTIDLSFYTTAEAPTEINDISGFEYRLDGGTWTSFEPNVDQYGTADATIPATNDVSHTVSVRTTSTAGPSTGVSAEPVTPYAPIAAPTITSVSTGPSSITLSWTAPSGVTVTGYDVGYNQGESGGQSCTTGPTVLTCTFAVPAGTNYTPSVAALDSAGRMGLRAFASAPVTVAGPAVPSSVPTKDDGDIKGPAGPISSLSAGQKVTLTGEGYAPNSTVQLTVFSSPVSLGTVVTDQDGAFSVEVTIPANLANGTHHLVATGIAPDGTTRNLVITVTVSGGVATLATTGFDAGPVALGGGLFLLAGAGLVVGARRRSTNA